MSTSRSALALPLPIFIIRARLIPLAADALCARTLVECVVAMCSGVGPRFGEGQRAMHAELLEALLLRHVVLLQSLQRISRRSAQPARRAPDPAQLPPTRNASTPRLGLLFRFELVEA